MPRVLACTGLVLIAGGCGGSSAGSPAARPTPDLDAFLRLPVATPSSCPPDTNGQTSGRRSPWVGTVDISVFLAAGASPRQAAALRDALEQQRHVRHVYAETRQQAYAEFQRLYTCSAQVPRSAVRASYRIVLDQVTRPERDDVVRAIYRLPVVGSISCDPSSPCVDIKRP